MNRRQALTATLIAGPAALLANTPQGDRPRGAARADQSHQHRSALHLEKPLKERFWMANAPIGGYQPRASRLIVRLHTDAGITGEGEGSGGADLFRKGFADLVVGEDPFMVGRIWEKMFAATYGREPSTRGWSAARRHQRHGSHRRRALRHHGQVHRPAALQVPGRLSRFRPGLRDRRLLPRRQGHSGAGPGNPRLHRSGIQRHQAESRRHQRRLHRGGRLQPRQGRSRSRRARRCASCSTPTTAGMSRPPSAPPTRCTTSTSPGSKSRCTGTTTSSRSSR